MSATIIDGRAIAKDLRGQIKDRVSTLPSQPGLAVILVGDDPASHVYVNNKIKATVNCGMRSIEKRLDSAPLVGI